MIIHPIEAPASIPPPSAIDESSEDIDFDLELPEGSEVDSELAQDHEPAVQEVARVDAPKVVATETPEDLDHLMIADIINVHSAAEFRSMFASFEEQIEAKLIPLKAYLRRVIMTSEIQQLEMHAAHVERFRSDVTRYLSLATAFVEHGRSSHFKMAQISMKRATIPEQDSYRRTLTAGYVALAMRLESLVDDIDSRVNLCKKFADGEKAGFKNFGGR